MDSTSKVMATFGAGSALWLSGFYFCSSQVAIPPLLALPAKLAVTSWNTIYYRAIPIVVPMTVLSVIATGTTAYLVPEKRIEFGVAAVSTLGGLAWTQLMMVKTNNRMMALEKDGVELEKVGDGGVRELLGKWKGLNTVRAGFGLVGGGVALWTLAN